MSVCIIALHLIVAWAFWYRVRIRHSGGTAMLVAALPAVVTSGLAMAIAPPPTRWPPPSTWMFIGGTAWTMTAMFHLRRDFAVMPAVRGLTTSGPFSIVRHPIYAGELVLVGACVVAAVTRGTATVIEVVAVGLLAVVGTMIRVTAEERLLTCGPFGDRLLDYRRRVRYRLIPGIY